MANIVFWGYTTFMIQTSSLAMRKLLTSKERQELRHLRTMQLRTKGIRLQYLKGSEKMSMRTMTGKFIDCRLWNVLAPKLEGYTYGPDSGIPTLGVEGLRKAGLI